MELRIVAKREGRLSSFLRGELKMSYGLMNKLKWGEALKVNGAPQRTNFPVKMGDVITVALEEERSEYPAEDGKLEILYEDEWILAVEKPAGMLIHPSRARLTGTLANLTAGYYERTGQKCAFHPLTRLDRDTFGIVLLGKSAHVHFLLQEGGCRKFYEACVLGGPEEAEGVIDAPIARRGLPSLLRYVDESGKESVSRWRVLERQEGCTKLELEAVTGRTHQLRVHCAYMGWPILGDPQYGSEASLEKSRELGLESQVLCARRLELRHPMTEENLILESKMEANMRGSG